MQLSNKFFESKIITHPAGWPHECVITERFSKTEVSFIHNDMETIKRLADKFISAASAVMEAGLDWRTVKLPGLLIRHSAQ